MRCLALAQAWQDVGGRAVFAMAESTRAIRERLLAESCAVLDISGLGGGQEDSRQTIESVRAEKAEWVVVDGYHFSAEYQDTLKTAGCKVLFVDDYGHAARYSADLVLNQNDCAVEAPYKNRDSTTHLLLGTRYCMLRREFRAWSDWKRESASLGRKLLVTMGGSDPDNVTLCVIHALQQMDVPDLEAMVVVGGSNPHLAAIQSAVADSRHNISMQMNTSKMPELMAWADLAISAAGSTSWELCAMGLPALLICVARNQVASAKCLAEQGAALVMDSLTEDRTSAILAAAKRLFQEPLLREQISGKARNLVDFEGASRVVARIKSLAGEHLS
jgi:UDP-2,4-diacetamido-2,4,6-trideoxy-beta-L-altropyranose hydrolase